MTGQRCYTGAAPALEIQHAGHHIQMHGDFVPSEIQIAGPTVLFAVMTLQIAAHLLGTVSYAYWARRQMHAMYYLIFKACMLFTLSHLHCSHHGTYPQTHSVNNSWLQDLSQEGRLAFHGALQVHAHGHAGACLPAGTRGNLQ